MLKVFRFDLRIFLPKTESISSHPEPNRPWSWPRIAAASKRKLFLSSRSSTSANLTSFCSSSTENFAWQDSDLIRYNPDFCPPRYSDFNLICRVDRSSDSLQLSCRKFFHPSNFFCRSFWHHHDVISQRPVSSQPSQPAGQSQ